MSPVTVMLHDWKNVLLLIDLQTNEAQFSCICNFVRLSLFFITFTYPPGRRERLKTSALKQHGTCEPAEAVKQWGPALFCVPRESEGLPSYMFRALYVFRSLLEARFTAVGKGMESSPAAEG